MLRNILITTAIIGSFTATAQQKQGRVIYQRTIEMNISMPGNPQMEGMIPKTRVNNFELNFNNTIASWKQAEEVEPEEAQAGLVIRFAGSDDLNWFDLATGRRLQQTELAGKNYLVNDSLVMGNWKITEETKNILGHLCRKAIATVAGKRMVTSMENGKMERKEVSDTSQSEAWFTTDIPVAAGPEIQGQLPGLILELRTRSGKVVYVAQEINEKPDLTALKEPTKGKKMNAADFAKERSRVMQEMEKNNAGPGGNIRFSVSQ